MTDLKKLYQSELPSRAIAVYLYLRGRTNKEGFCWPAVPTMARELKMSESTVRRGVRDLEKVEPCGFFQPIYFDPPHLGRSVSISYIQSDVPYYYDVL